MKIIFFLKNCLFLKNHFLFPRFVLTFFIDQGTEKQHINCVWPNVLHIACKGYNYNYNNRSLYLLDLDKIGFEYSFKYAKQPRYIKQNLI